MKQKILYVFILFSFTWLCFLIIRHTGFGSYIREQIEGYLVDYSTTETSVDVDALNKDQLKLRSLRQVPQDSIVIVLLSDSLQNKGSVLHVIDELIPAEPAVVGIDIIFVNQEDTTDFVSEITKRSKQYPNLVLAYSRPNETDGNTLFPLGITDFNDFPNLGYTNFGLDGKEARYLDLFAKVDGVNRPAFWTILWSKCHSNKQCNYGLKSRRRFINYNFRENDLQLFEIKKIADLHNPYYDVLPPPLEAIKGKMVIVGWIGNDDSLIVPVHDRTHEMPGIYVIGTALNTIVYNELSNSIADRYRDLIAIIVLLLVCFLFAYASETEFYHHWSNLIQLLLGILLFILAPHLSLSHDEVWTVFSVIVVFVLITPAIDDCYRYIGERLVFLKGKKHNNAE